MKFCRRPFFYAPCPFWSWMTLTLHNFLTFVALSNFSFLNIPFLISILRWVICCCRLSEILSICPVRIKCFNPSLLILCPIYFNCSCLSLCISVHFVSVCLKSSSLLRLSCYDILIFFLLTCIP